MGIEIIDVCSDYVIINKPHGVLSEKPTGNGENVPDLLAAELDDRGIKYECVYTTHRLDRTTAGLMVYALSKKAAAGLSSIIANGEMHKTYAAYLTRGEGLADSGELRDMLFFDRRADKSFVVRGNRAGAKEAILNYVIAENGKICDYPVSLAKVSLITGRTHQIRVQFASRKSPLIGDKKYGSRVPYKGCALFSTELEFPWDGENRRYTLPPHNLF